VSYLLQIRALEREALAMQSQAPFVTEGSHLPSVAEVIAEFDGWLSADPMEDQPPTSVDMEMQQLHRAMGLRGRG
jgi:hypothetical protein